MARCQVTSEKSSKNYISLFGGKPARGLPTPPPTSPRAVTTHFTCGGQQVRTASVRFTRGNPSRRRGGRPGWFAKRCHSLTDHRIDCKLKTKIANTILLLCYLDKICLILTGGLWPALANLYSGREAIKGSLSQWPALSQLHYILQATPLWRRKSATATHVEQ